MNDFLEMAVIPIGLLGLILCLILFGAFCLITNIFIQPQLQMETNWSNLCRENGGTVQYINDSQLECFKNEKIILHIN